VLYLYLYFSFWLFFVHTNLYPTINLSWTWYLWSIKTFMFTVCTIGYNEFNSFILLTRWWLQSLILYKNRILLFELFCSHLPSKFRKSANMIQKIFLCTNSIWVSKRRILFWFRIGWKNFKTFHRKKLWTKMWWKYALFSLLLMFVKFVSLITFVSTDLKPAWNSVFLYP
jgi:hypothetical protein